MLHKMLPMLLVTLALWVYGQPAVAQQPKPPRPLASALSAASAGEWDKAANLGARDGPAAASLIEWTRLRAGQGSAAEVLGFLAAHPDWPGLDLLRRRSEPVFDMANDAETLAFYNSNPPQTGEGILRHAQALRRAGQEGAADAAIVAAWLTFDLTSEAQAAFLAAYASLLKPHHAARLDMALWRGLDRVARQMLPLVGEATQKLALARLALQAKDKNVDGLIAGLSDKQRDDAGLNWDRFQWRLQKSSAEAAIELMQERSTSAEALGQPEKWGSWRRYLARNLMRDGKPKQAYKLATTHHLTTGSDYADLEWLAGYIALRQLNDPASAVRHFTRFRAAVDSPISLGRAGYWLGRAEEAAGDAAAADMAYHAGAEHQTSFYGLLAAEKVGQPFDAELAGKETFPDWRRAAFAKSDVFQVGILAKAMGNLSLAEQFFLHMAKTMDRSQLGQMGQMAMDIGAPHLAVMLGKEGASRGITLPGPYYPLHPMRKLQLGVPMELALSIARRESEFDPSVMSGAGAMGLMQLMPGTAADVARDLGLDHSRAKVLSDWGYNAVLGSAYLAGLGRRFDGNIVMVAAGYNAGPGRPNQWMEQFGDPRKGGMDVIDWIEMIPFRETQNYVMRVAESLPVYRARLGRDPLPVPFSAELVGTTVRPLN